MKRIIFAICTILCANVLFAQEQLAVLKHNDSTSVFYGANAFVQAYNAAANGDIITLSDGIFTAPGSSILRLEKEITVRGNGAVPDTSRRSSGTYFLGPVYTLRNIDFQGIYFSELRLYDLRTIKLTKCFVRFVDNYDRSTLYANNCVIAGILDNNSLTSTFINCVLYGTYNWNSTPHYELPQSANCTNCIIKGDDHLLTSSGISQFNNCIIINTDTTDNVLNAAVNNSVLIGWTGSNSPVSSGNVVMSLSDVFENWDGTGFPTDLETYVLKSSVSDSIQGLDGSEVGIFGGFMPFDWRPSYSVIKRFNVANRTTADGKLSVDIEVISE